MKKADAPPALLAPALIVTVCSISPRQQRVLRHGGGEFIPDFSPLVKSPVVPWWLRRFRRLKQALCRTLGIPQTVLYTADGVPLRRDVGIWHPVVVQSDGK